MRFASPSCGSFAHGFLGFIAFGALLSGCADDPGGNDDAGPPGPPPLELLAGNHSVLRRGADVSGYCAARSGARTAVAKVEAQRFAVLTSDSPELEPASFSAAPEVSGYDGAIECSLVPTATGFTTAWVSSGGEGLVRVQRLFADGSPEGETIALGPSSFPRASLLSDGERIYVGRLATAAEGTEVWVDVIEGVDVTSQLLTVCEQPTLPALVTGPGAAGVFYACRGAEQVELFGLLLGDEAPVSLGTAPAAIGQMALSAVSFEGSWLVQWIPPGTAADALPPLLELDPETLEATEHAGAERQALLGEEPWLVELVVSGDAVFRQLGICTLADAEMPGCHIELCALNLAEESESCSKIEQGGTPGTLLGSEFGLSFLYFEQGLDFGGDLYSLALDRSAAVAAKPRPITAPGPFAPLGVDCAGAWCTVFGREGQSLFAGPDLHRYGFWTSEDVSNPDAARSERIVLEADGPVVASPIDPASWSVGLAYRDAAGLRVGAFTAEGPLYTQPVADAGEPAALFFEASAARYRVFEQGADGLLISRTVDAGGAGAAGPVDAPVLQVMCSVNGGYLALDPATRTYYRLSDGGGTTGGELLPPIREGSTELWRCVGDSVYGLAYNGTGALAYRGARNDAGALSFETWTFGGEPEGDGALGGGFGAVAGDLADQRVVFFVARAGGFSEPLVAIVLGAEGAPLSYALELPEEAFLSAAAAPSLGDPSVLRLAWSELGTRKGTVSTWALP